jgi:cation diffusion facilitator family transporter
MTEMLIKKFIKNPEDIDNLKVRRSYGTLSSFVGIICNIFLFCAKYLLGTFSNSISIVSDAFNNLTDSAGCIVTLLGYKMSSKPADKNHPFGHGRMEYLSTLTIAIIILMVGFELLKNSFSKIIHPDELKFSIITIISLILSVCLKLWMSCFNNKLGKKINSGVLIATSKDSKTDAVATSATIIAIITSLFTKFPVDGVIGILVSIFIMKSGYDIIKDTIDDLLGKPADPELVKSIKEYIQQSDKIIGIHDLIIHNYGPGNMIASCHAEVRSDEDFIAVHDSIDIIEREIYSKLNILMTIHMDPVEVDNELVNKCKSRILEIVETIDDSLCIHDFRIVTGETHTNLVFDLVVPYGFKYKNEDIKKIIDDNLKDDEIKYFTVITFDSSYT